MRFVQGGGIGDALRALLSREGIDQQVRRAHEPRIHGGGGLDGHQRVHQVLIDAAAELGECLGQDEVRLRAIRVDLTESTGVHHGHIGAQALADVFIGGAQLVFEQFQSEQHPGRHRGPAPLGALFGKAPGKVLLHHFNHGVPREGLGPQADGVCLWDELGGQELRTASG